MSDAYTRSIELENAELLREIRDRLPEKPLMACNRRQFETMLPSEQMQFIKRGGKIADDGTGARVRGHGGQLI